MNLTSKGGKLIRKVHNIIRRFRWTRREGLLSESNARDPNQSASLHTRTTLPVSTRLTSGHSINNGIRGNHTPLPATRRILTSRNVVWQGRVDDTMLIRNSIVGEWKGAQRVSASLNWLLFEMRLDYIFEMNVRKKSCWSTGTDFGARIIQVRFPHVLTLFLGHWRNC